MITSADEFYKLRKSADPNDYYRASNEEISYDTCLEIISKYPDMKKWVVHNKKVPIAILKLLVTDMDDDVRLTIAMKRKIDEVIFDKLSEDNNYSVKLALIHNPKVPSFVLEKLSFDKDNNIANEAKKKLMR